MYQGVPPVPDPTFVKDLKDFDPKLRVQFDRKSERFVITKRRAYGPEFYLLMIARDDGGFRQPDQRDIRMLYDGDLWRHGGVKERVRKGEEYMKAHEEKQEKDAEDELRARSREDRLQLSNTYRKAFNEGSKAPEFRRVELNRRGLTVDQIRAARATGRDPWQTKSLD